MQNKLTFGVWTELNVQLYHKSIRRIDWETVNSSNDYRTFIAQLLRLYPEGQFVMFEGCIGYWWYNFRIILSELISLSHVACFHVVLAIGPEATAETIFIRVFTFDGIGSCFIIAIDKLCFNITDAHQSVLFNLSIYILDWGLINAP